MDTGQIMADRMDAEMGRGEAMHDELLRLQAENEMWKTRIESITSIIGDAQKLLPADGKALMRNYERLKEQTARDCLDMVFSTIDESRARIAEHFNLDVAE